MSDVVKFLRERAGVSRVNYAYDDLIFNFGDWYGIQTVSGFVPSAPEAVWKLGFWNSRVLDLYGVRYHVGRQAPAGAGPEVFASAQGWKIWERPSALPRAWVAHEFTVARDREEAYRAVLAPEVDLRNRAILDRQVSVEACQDPGTVRIDRYRNQYVALDAELPCAGVMVLSDNWYPGWNATLDGRQVPLMLAYGALRAVVVPAGRHRVEMRYSPASIRWGGILSVTTFLAVGSIAVIRRKQILGAGLLTEED
jgi:hypothetical protein